MSYTIEKKPSQILLTILGDLAIGEVKGLRDDLVAAVSDPLPVFVNATDAKRIDISVVQVLYAVHKTVGKLTVQDCSLKVREYLEWAGVFMDRWTDQPSIDENLLKGAGNG